jgi:hypothetical protein
MDVQLERLTLRDEGRRAFGIDAMVNCDVWLYSLRRVDGIHKI